MAGDVEMPLLPLQNTVSCSAQEDAASNCLDRYMLVNTEAYTLSYTFSGDFGVVDSEPGKINAHFSDLGGLAVEPGNVLGGEHVGGTGCLYLMLSMHQNTARLAVRVPNDRALYAAQWLRSLLVSFTVVDLTEYALPETHANVCVMPTMTVHSQAISYCADRLNACQNETSLFNVQANGFGERTPCTHDCDTHPLGQIDIALWNASMPELYSWVEQRNHNDMLFKVSMSCLFNNMQSECWDLQNVGEVFVMLCDYEYKAPKQHNVGHCNSFICTDTADKTLLGLLRVYEHIPGSPVADGLAPDAAARVQYQLQDTDSVQVNIQQAHVSRALAQCALLLTTSISTADTTQQSILCVDADSAHKVRSELPATKYCGTFIVMIHGHGVLLLLI